MFAHLSPGVFKGIISPCVIKDPKTQEVIFVCKKDKNPNLTFPCPKARLFNHFIKFILGHKRAGDWDRKWFEAVCDTNSNPTYGFNYNKQEAMGYNYYAFIALYMDNIVLDLRNKKSILEVAGTESISCRGPFLIQQTQSFMDMHGWLYPGEEIEAVGRKEPDGHSQDKAYTRLGFIEGTITRVISDLSIYQPRFDDLVYASLRSDVCMPCMISLAGALGQAQMKRSGSELEGAKADDGDIGNQWDSPSEEGTGIIDGAIENPYAGGAGPQQAGIITGDGLGGANEAPVPSPDIPTGDEWWNTTT